MISFFTLLTPLTLRAMDAAALRSAASFAKPDSITVPLSVSTLIAAALTSLLSTKRAFTAAVIALSSTYSPTVDWPRLTAQPDSAEIVRLVLLAAEATVFTASNGIEALDIFRRESPTMVLTDLSMPERDGWQLLQDIRSSENGTRTPVLALTAHAMVGDKDRVMEAGFNGYLSKPLRMVTLLADLRACLENNSNEVDANKE